MISAAAVQRACALALCAALLGACGAAEEGRPASANARGRQLFGSVGCGNCHTLDEAGAAGQVGPDLDRLRPSVDQVTSAVRNGRPGMPEFGDRISEPDLRALAEYVAAAAGR